MSQANTFTANTLQHFDIVVDTGAAVPPGGAGAAHTLQIYDTTVD